MATLTKEERAYQKGYQARIRGDAQVGRAIRAAVEAEDKDALMTVVAAVIESIDAKRRNK